MKKNSILHEIKTLNMQIIKKISKENGVEERRGKRLPSPTQMQILGYIFEHKNEEIYQKDLENIFNLSRTTVSGVLRTMEKNKLIDRVTDTVDTRTKKIILNKKAKEIFESHNEYLTNLEKKMMSNISESELATFYTVIEKMKNNLF